MTTLVNKIRTLGEKMEEMYIVKKFLHVVPAKFLQIVSTIEQFIDLTTMTVDYLIGRLKVHENRLANHGNAREEHMLLTRATHCRIM